MEHLQVGAAEAQRGGVVHRHRVLPQVKPDGHDHVSRRLTHHWVLALGARLVPRKHRVKHRLNLRRHHVFVRNLVHHLPRDLPVRPETWPREYARRRVRHGSVVQTEHEVGVRQVVAQNLHPRQGVGFGRHGFCWWVRLPQILCLVQLLAPMAMQTRRVPKCQTLTASYRRYDEQGRTAHISN